MSFVVVEMTMDSESGDEPISNKKCHGPFPSHAKANRFMQDLYDTALGDPDFEGWDGDDTEASHFYLTNGLGRSHNYLVMEMERGLY